VDGKIKVTDAMANSMLELRNITKIPVASLQTTMFRLLFIRERYTRSSVRTAGKSTIMRIAYGFYNADSDPVDRQRVSIKKPSDAIALGIGMVHQHFMLVDTMIWLPNIILPKRERRRIWISIRQTKDKGAFGRAKTWCES
jgi:simple sugar transport system ATP-binding protein